MQILAKIFDLILDPKPSIPFHGAGVSGVTPLYKGTMKPLGALNTQTYTYFSSFATDT